MKIKKILLSIAIVLIAMGVFCPGGSLAQQGTPPNIKVSLALTNSQQSYQPDLVYLWNDPIRMVITLENKEAENVITTKGFPQRPFHLLLIFTGPDGKTILTHDPGDTSQGDAPPPRVFPVQDQLKQVDPVESLTGGWVVSVEIPDAHAYYTLTITGNYSVKALIPMRTYKTVNYPGPPENYSEIDDFKWSGALSSNTEKFTLLADADSDGFFYPEGFPSGALADCNDNDPKEKPGQTWYKDADGDGYSDGTINTASCTRPIGYKVASELAAMTIDCNDGNSNVNPGMIEVVCNGIDDDCNPATPDVPAPTLASPANEATGISTTPTLSWGASCTGSSYRLQVSTTDTFSTTVFDQSGIAGTSRAVSGLANSMLYYWRVNATNAGGTSEWSSVWSFTTIVAAPSAPTLASPTNGVTGVPLTPTLSWNASGGAASYGLQVSTSSTFQTTVVDQSPITTTSYSVPTGTLSTNTLYYWRVNATNAGGTSPWSTPWSFTTISLGPLDHIIISPDTATIIVGGSQAYTATGYDQYNNSWDITSTTALSISPNGSCNNTTHTCSATIVGTHTVTGNYAGKTDWATLDVIYNFTGFLSPVLNLPDINTTTAGNTVPLKWRLTDSRGVGISNRSSFVSLTSVKVSCETWAPIATPVTETSGIRYNDDGYWQYNWRTTKTTGCYIVTIELLDGTKHSAKFRLVK